MTKMVPVPEAHAAILSRTQQLEPVVVLTDAAVGLVLAETLMAPENHPAFPASVKV